ncbi:MAG: diguanylate cyclase [Methylothermaceae bacterium]|nr:diguanylate cyclase [Methylothermaceae bacterium]
MVDPHQLFTRLLLQLYGRANAIFAVHCAFACLLAWFLWFELSRPIFLVWSVVVVAGGLWQWLVGRATLRRLANLTVTGGTIVPHVVAAGAGGISFGMTALLFPGLSLATKNLIILTLGVIAATFMPRLAALPSAFAAFLTGITGPLLAALILADEASLQRMIPVVLLMAVSLLFSVRTIHGELLDGVLVHFGLESAAGEDQLTRIPNRRRFDQALELEWRRACRVGAPLSLIMVDVDFFKKFNDRYGHQEGDRCLAQVAQALFQSARRITDLVARYGGEEFVVLLNHATRDDAFDLCEKMRIAVEQYAMPHADSPHGHVTISMGGASVFADEKTNPLELVRAADKALYRAKASGRNRVVWYDPAVDGQEEMPAA